MWGTGEPRDAASRRRNIPTAHSGVIIMRNPHKPVQIAALGMLVAVSLFAAGAFIKNLQPFRDRTGFIATYNTAGDIDETNAFFRPLGTNGRTCATCHQVDQAMSLEVEHVRQRFIQTGGQDPLFAPVDGANCPDAQKGDAAAHSLLLNNGLIRVGITLPEKTEFDLTVVHDPHGCAITTDEATGRQVVSVYRRPLPSTNLRFLSTVMWDGRETLSPLSNQETFQQNLVADLKHQALGAVMGHAQANNPPTEAQLLEIVDFELGLFSAQINDRRAGVLYGDRALGGPLHLQAQEYYPGINDSLGNDPRGDKFDLAVFDLYTHWLPGIVENRDSETTPNQRAARAAIASGESIFNTTPLKITSVRGLNDNPSLGNPKEIIGTCTTCHDTPNVGNHSLPLPLDIATSHAALGETDANIATALAELSQPDVPIYLVTNCPNPREPDRLLTFYTSDPGKGLLTGKCSDVNRIKGPILRGLAARAPYFHNGAARNLDELVNFYNKRFQMNLTDKQKGELVAFLNSL
jgi:cytochrome c peroxidase